MVFSVAPCTQSLYLFTATQKPLHFLMGWVSPVEGRERCLELATKAVLPEAFYVHSLTLPLSQLCELDIIILTVQVSTFRLVK